MKKRTRVLAGLTGPTALLAIVAMTAIGSPAGASNLSHRPGAAAASGATAVPAVTTTPGFNAFSSTMQSAGMFCDNPADAPCFPGTYHSTRRLILCAVTRPPRFSTSHSERLKDCSYARRKLLPSLPEVIENGR